MNDEEKCLMDIITFGKSVMQNGKHVPIGVWFDESIDISNEIIRSICVPAKLLAVGPQITATEVLEKQKKWFSEHDPYAPLKKYQNLLLKITNDALMRIGLPPAKQPRSKRLMKKMHKRLSPSFRFQL